MAVMLPVLGWLVYLALGNTLLKARLENAAREAGVSLDIGTLFTFIPGRLTLENVSAAREGAWRASARRAECDFDTSAMLGGSLDVEHLTAEGARVHVFGLTRNDIALARTEKPALAKSPAKASLALAGAVESEQFLVRRAEASGTRLTIGRYRLDGDIHYQLEAARLGAETKTGHLSVTLAGTHLSVAGAPCATLSGKVGLEVVPDARQSDTALQAGEAPLVNADVDVSGKLTSLAPWTRLGPFAPRFKDASYRARLHSRQSDMSSAQIELRSSELSFTHRDGARTDLSGAVGLHVSLDRTRRQPLRVALEANRARLSDRSGSTKASLRDLTFQASLPAGTDSTSTDGSGTLKLSVAKARMAALSATLTARVEASGIIAHSDVERGTLKLTRGTVHAENGTVTADDSRVSHGFDATLDLDSAELSPAEGLEFRGALRLSGKDASMLLDLANASETVRWTLSLLEGEPFSVTGRVTDSGQAFRLDDLSLKSGNLSASGAAYSNDAKTRGVFLVQGPLPIGVTLDSAGVDAQAPVSRAWLDQHLKSLESEELHDDPT